MTSKHFTRIEEPSNSITDIASSYRRQNILSQKIRQLYNSFDGLKIGNWKYGNTALPYIMAGSIIEFDGEIYEASSDIILVDNTTDINKDKRWFSVAKISHEGSYYLDVAIIQGNTFRAIATYDYNRRGFYYANTKDLRINFRYDHNSKLYVAKNVWDINDTERYGNSTVKKAAIYRQPGEFIFDFPPEAKSIEIELIGAGGGGGGIRTTNGHHATDGGLSRILIGGFVICSCGGGKYGQHGVGNGSWYGDGGDGGSAFINIGLENIGKTWTGGKGSPGTANNYAPANGGSVQGDVVAYGGQGGKGGTWSGANSGGGGAGASAKITINRDMLDTSKQIKIIVGTGGLGDTSGSGTNFTAGTDGENGSCNITYYERTVSA